MHARSESHHAPSVSAAELVRNFAECRETAGKKHLYVTHHGRATHVLLGIDEYQGLHDAARSREAGEHPPGDAALLQMLAQWLDEAIILCDADMTIAFANRVTQALCRRTVQELVDRPLVEALPQIAGSMLEVHARRTAIGGESSTADIPSPFHEDRWLRFQSLPLGDWNALLFRDITDEVRHHRLADVQEAILDAMRAHGDIAFVRVSIRGTIERVNEPWTRLIGLPADRLHGIALADVIATPDRARFREALEAVIRGAGSRRVDAHMLTNDGDLAPLHLALEPLQGIYGSEGAVMLATTVPN